MTDENATPDALLHGCDDLSQEEPIYTPAPPEARPTPPKPRITAATMFEPDPTQAQSPHEATKLTPVMPTQPLSGFDGMLADVVRTGAPVTPTQPAYPVAPAAHALPPAYPVTSSYMPPYSPPAPVYAPPPVYIPFPLLPPQLPQPMGQTAWATAPQQGLTLGAAPQAEPDQLDSGGRRRLGASSSARHRAATPPGAPPQEPEQVKLGSSGRHRLGSSGARHRAAARLETPAQRDRAVGRGLLAAAVAIMIVVVVLVMTYQEEKTEEHEHVADTKAATRSPEVVVPQQPAERMPSRLQTTPKVLEGQWRRPSSSGTLEPEQEAPEADTPRAQKLRPEAHEEPRATDRPDPKPEQRPSATPLPAPTAQPPKADPAPVEKPDPTPAKPVAGEITEQYDSGKVKARYRVDMNGKKDGIYVSYYENGQLAIRATYNADVLVGSYKEFHPNGRTKSKRTYNKKGQIHGRDVEYDEAGRVLSDFVFVDGHLCYTKTPEQIAKAFAQIERTRLVLPAGKPTCDEVTVYDADEQVRGLRRLLEYRALCDVPTDVTLDFSLAEKAAAGVKLLSFVGLMTHTPEKPPGVSDQLYKIGFEGTSHCNLYSGEVLGDIPSLVDGWIEDPGENNAGIAGHRRWCLDPAMKHTAFAKAGGNSGGKGSQFAALYAMDGSGRDVPEVPGGIIAWPARGYCPTTLFKAGSQWSVSLDPRRFGSVPSTPYLVMRYADEALKDGDMVECESVKVDRSRFGSFGDCVTWKPKTTIAPGSRFWVKLRGVKDLQGAPADIEYLVEFYQP